MGSATGDRCVGNINVGAALHGSGGSEAMVWLQGCVRGGLYSQPITGAENIVCDPGVGASGVCVRNDPPFRILRFG
jgi:hypothetical protein